jgi:hypothetical protein
MFDCMGALSTSYNDDPATASRAFDKTRDGFVIAGGGGIVVLEELEHAKARGAKIYAELVGYGANSDGYDMVAPSGVGGQRCMKLAMDEATRIAGEKPIDCYCFIRNINYRISLGSIFPRYRIHTLVCGGDWDGMAFWRRCRPRSMQPMWHTPLGIGEGNEARSGPTN